VGFETFNILTMEQHFAEFDSGNTPGTLSFVSTTTRPSVITALMARNPDSIDHTVRYILTVDGDGVTLGEVLIPAGSGVGIVPPVDCLAIVASPQLGLLWLPPLSHFSVSCLEAILADELDVIATFGFF
jgi:hypothetical protein